MPHCINCHQPFSQSKKSEKIFYRCQACATMYKKHPCQCIIDRRYCINIATSNCKRMKALNYCARHNYLPQPFEESVRTRYTFITMYIRYTERGDQIRLASLSLEESTLPLNGNGARGCVEMQENLNGRTPYEVLGLNYETCSIEDIRRTYRRLSLKYHPDKNIDNPNAHSNFLKIKHAYEDLTLNL